MISHAEAFREFMRVTPEFNPYGFAKEAMLADDPEGASLLPDQANYSAALNRPEITFDRRLTLRLGKHTFELISTPGHSKGLSMVFIPEERVAFTGDNIFSGCQTWLMEADPDVWLACLARIQQLEIDHIIPGHGPVCTKAYIPVQSAFLREWVTEVAKGIAKGWSKEECMKRISFRDRFPVGVGLDHMGPWIQECNAGALYDRLMEKK